MPLPLIPLTTALEKQVTVSISYLLCEIKMPVTIVSSQSLQYLFLYATSSVFFDIRFLTRWSSDGLWTI